MSTLIQGKLLTPLGGVYESPAIRFTATATEGGISLKGNTDTYSTLNNGDYSFTLEEGRYLFEILYTDTYIETGTVLIDANSPPVMNLQALMQYGAPYTPPIVDNSPVVWNELLNNVIQNDEWERSSEDQLRFEDTLVNKNISIHKAEAGYASINTQTTATELGETFNQAVSYSDGVNRTFHKHTTVAGNSNQSVASYTYSNGDYSLTNGVQLVGENSKNISEDTASTLSVTSTSTKEVDTSSDVEGYTLFAGSLNQTRLITLPSITYSKNALLADGVYSAGEWITSGNILGHETTSISDGELVKSVGVDVFNVGNARGGSEAPTFTVNTLTNVVTISGRLEISNAEDFQGASGWSYDTDLQWGMDGDSTLDTDWFEDYQPSYIWQRGRKYKFIEGKLSTTKTYIEPWGTPIRLNAIDGLAADEFWIKYEYSVSDNGPWVSAGLYDANLHEWRRYSYVVNGEAITDINHPLYGPRGGWFHEQILGVNGVDGKTVVIQYRYSRNAGIPDSEGEDPWHANITDTDYYRQERVAYFDDPSTLPNIAVPASWPYGTPYMATEWGNLIKFKPEYGIDYSDGETGLHGNGSFRVFSETEAAIPATDAGKDEAILLISGRPAQDGDLLNIYNNGADKSLWFSRYWFRQGGVWVEAVQVVDGNMVIDGTLAARHIQTASLTTDLFKADQVYAGHIEAKSIELVGSDVQIASNNYVLNETGWAINSNGVAQFNSLNIRNGNVELIGNNTMSISRSTPFGSLGFIRWTGPTAGKLDANGNVIEGNITDTGALEYLTDTGILYIGGAIIAGALKNSWTTTKLGLISEEGQFGSLGGLIEINFSGLMTGSFNRITGTGTVGTGPASFKAVLERKLTSGGTYVTLAELVGVGQWEVVKEGPEYLGDMYCLGSLQYTDILQSTADRFYRIRWTETVSGGGVPISKQSLSFISAES